MGDRGATSMHPYAVLGALLAGELDARPPRLSRRRKRLLAAIQARLAVLAVEAEPVRPPRPEDLASRSA
jgi:hypothetical protein